MVSADTAARYVATSKRAHFIRARNACKAAVEDRLNHQHARDEFIAASEEAKLSTYPSRRSFTELCD
ncbi:DUF982 domain-containing protein [Rhizobium leguminosarum]